MSGNVKTAHILIPAPYIENPLTSGAIVIKMIAAKEKEMGLPAKTFQWYFRLKDNDGMYRYYCAESHKIDFMINHIRVLRGWGERKKFTELQTNNQLKLNNEKPCN